MRPVAASAKRAPDDPEPARPPSEYLRRLGELAAAAEPGTDVAEQAAALVEAQRVAAIGLRAAVTAARRSGMSWRDLAELLDVPPATLHRQYRAGGRLAAHGAPTRGGGAPPAEYPLELAPLDHHGTVLSARETEIAQLVAYGHTTKQIAARLSIGARTVETHVASIRAKLGCSTRAHIALWVGTNLFRPGFDAPA